MLKYEWVKGRNRHTEGQKEYFFSNFRDAFRYVVYAIHENNGNKNAGYAVFSISTDKGRTKVKLLDHHAPQPAGRRAILALSVQVAESVDADCLDLSEQTATCMNIGILRHLLTRRKERRYLYSVSEEVINQTEWMNKMNPDYCDGDTAFT
jgi:hypothetical protein